MDVDQPLIFPTSFAQQRLLLVEQLVPGTAAFHIPAALRLRGQLDRDALARAVNQVVERHEALRTVFLVVDGEAMQLVDPDLRVPVEERDLTGTPATGSEDALLEVLAADAERPFALGQRAARVTLWTLGPDDHVFTLTLHHTIADLWSGAVFFRELAHFYAGGDALPELEIQYVDYAIWQREQLTGAAEAELAAYWRQALAGAPHQLEVPGDRPRPAEPSLRGGSEPVRMPAEVARGVRALARDRNATPYMVLLAGWDALLARWTGQSDLVVSTGVATRTSQVEDLIGCFVNVLLVRASTAGDPGFATLVDRVARATLDAVDHQDLPFDRVVHEIAPGSRGGHQPLTQVMLNLQNAPAPDLRLPGLAVEAVVVPRRAAQLDLALDLWTVGDRYDGVVEYSSDVFDPDTVRALWDQYVVLLAAAVGAPDTPLSRLPLRDPAAGPPEWLQPPALPEQDAPDGPAATGAGTVEPGTAPAGPSRPVAVPAVPAADSGAAQLAALAAGTPYHPVDPAHPAALTERLLTAPVPAGTAAVTGHADGAAVALPPGAVAAAIAALTGDDGIRAGDRLVPQPSWGGERIPYGPVAVLAAGATLLTDPGGSTVFLGTAAELAAALDGPDTAGLRLVVLVGERPGPDLRDRLAAAVPAARLRHLAGPLEAAMGAALTGDGTGRYRPVPGVGAVVVDRTGQVAAPAQPGLLHLWGPATALASPRLVPHPLAGTAGVPAGAVAARTGLTARYRPGGIDVAEPLRVDGYEVDPAAVADLLAGHPAVREAAVLIEDGRLVAWHAGGTEAELVAHLAARLPAFARPVAYSAVDRLPTRADGSLDPAGLPRRPAATPGSGAGPVLPRTPVETVVTGVWASVLGTSGLGVDDDFLDLGGHSIAAMQVAALLGDTLGIQVPVRAVFSAGTPAGLAAWLCAHGRETGVDVDAAATDALAVGELSDDEVRELLADGS